MQATTSGNFKTVKVKDEDFIVPNGWSENAAYIAATKYARKGESSASDIFRRVTNELYVDPFNAEIIANLQLRQVFAFNSPVYFNLGVYADPILSACFILDVEDNIADIQQTCMDAWKVFIGGAGIGLDLSSLRESGAPIRGVAGASCGPLPLVAKVLDAIGHATRSGGVTRRSAIMLTMRDYHPDVVKFIEQKMNTEKLLHSLATVGIDTNDMNNPIYDHIENQTANRAVVLCDQFMHEVEEDRMWEFMSPYDWRDKGTMPARQLLRTIAKSLWACGDPGIQFYDTINKANPTPTAGSINTSNPCSEYLYIPNTACNLASMNLSKFFRIGPQTWDYNFFLCTVENIIAAQDGIVDKSSYPTKKIEENVKKYRPLGLGFSNLGALLMSMGVSYDSDEGRLIASFISASMTAKAFIKSSQMAEKYSRKLEDPYIYTLLQKHLDGMSRIYQHLTIHTNYETTVDGDKWVGLKAALIDTYEDLMEVVVAKKPIGNALTTLVAPTGTISFLMDCDTTGIEPAYALSYEKELVGGGTLRQPLACLREGLLALDYGADVIGQILFRVRNNQPITDLLDEVDVPVFATAAGENALTPEAHLDMMASVQPFISGAISKTVNLPSSATVEDIERYIKKAWKLGLKAVTFYRDASKAAQPLHVTLACAACGAELVRTGTCMACPNCGESSGVCS